MSAAKRWNGLAQAQMPDQTQVEVVNDAIGAATDCRGDTIWLLMIERSQDAFAGKHTGHRRDSLSIENTINNGLDVMKCPYNKTILS